MDKLPNESETVAMTAGAFNQNKQIAALVIYAVIFVDVLVVASIGITQGASSGQVGDGVYGLGYFKPFTMDSNILSGISSLILIFYTLRSLRQGKDSIPDWAVILQLMSVACLSLTIFIAAAFLGPMEMLGGRSYFVMFRDDMFFFHLLNPVLAIVCFIWLQPHHRFVRTECLFGAIPTVIYSIVYLVMVVFLKQWNDFYGFTFGGQYELVPVVILVIYALILGISFLLIKTHNHNVK